MRKLFPLLALIPTPALAEPWQKWETTYQVTSAVDAVQTCDFVARGRAIEINPILGRHPSCGSVIGFKIGTGIIHYLLVREVAKHDPNAAKWVAIASVVFQGGVVLANLKFVF